jgi:excisionase family DNA binding protein
MRAKFDSFVKGLDSKSWPQGNGNSTGNERKGTTVDQYKHGREKRLFNIKEAAMYLGRSEWSVRRLIWGGDLPEVRHGRRVQLDVCDLDAFIDRNKMPHC